MNHPRPGIADRARRGFTMVELLVVIGIIALMMSAFGLVLANFVQGARVQATRATISKIDAILKQRMDAFREQDFTAAANRLFNAGSVTTVEAGKVLALKQAFRVTFPQQAGDNNRPPFDTIAPLTATTPEAESAAYLYTIITRGATYGTPSVDEGTFTSSETRTEAGVTYFIDAWGQPLHFYRSPTRLFWLGEDFNGNGSLDTGEDDVDGDGNVTPTTAQQTMINFSRELLAPSVRFVQAGSAIHPLRIDPEDRLNRLRSLVVNTAIPPVVVPAQWTQYELVFQTPSTYSTPLIVSSGPDRTLGLEIPGATAASRRALPIASVLAGDPTPLTDNVTNLNLQSLGGN